MTRKSKLGHSDYQASFFRVCHQTSPHFLCQTPCGERNSHKIEFSYFCHLIPAISQTHAIFLIKGKTNDDAGYVMHSVN